MQLKHNTYYRTRGGQQEYVGIRHPDGWWFGWDCHGENERRSWEGNGRCPEDPKFDLIAIWVDRPADEDGWEIVDDPEAVVEEDWQFGLGRQQDWTPMLGACEYIGKRVRECPLEVCQWRWFRRPVKKQPREWWILIRDRDQPLAFWNQYNAVGCGGSENEIVHVREVIE